MTRRECKNFAFITLYDFLLLSEDLLSLSRHSLSHCLPLPNFPPSLRCNMFSLLFTLSKIPGPAIIAQDRNPFRSGPKSVLLNSFLSFSVVSFLRRALSHMR